MTREEMIKKAVDAQANDWSLWGLNESYYVNYLQESLRSLHLVIAFGDENALNYILKQSEENESSKVTND